MQSAALFRQVRFLQSAPDLRHIGPDTGREVAFAGRSNAGKSTALNALVGQKSLARTSKTPGRTQMINLFGMGEGDWPAHRLVDLPGYGYAKVPEKVRRDWGAAMGHYFAERASLAGVVVIMDIRHPPKPADLQMLEYAAARELPTLGLLTKADKLKFGQQKQAVMRMIRDHGLPGRQFMPFSGLKPDNAAAVRELILEWMMDDQPDHTEDQAAFD